MTRLLTSAATIALIAGLGIGGMASAQDIKQDIKDVITSETEQTEVAVNQPATQPVLVLKRQTETAAQSAPMIEESDTTAFGGHNCNKQETAQSHRIITTETN